MTILPENVISALHYAIYARQKEEKDNCYTADSALVAGWKLMRDALIKGEKVEIK